MDNQQKKVYTMEDNVKYISFGIKDLVKELQTLNAQLEKIGQILSHKSDDMNSMNY